MPPLTWWRGIQARKMLEDYFAARLNETRDSEGTDMLSVLCHAEDEDGQRFTDDDIVAHMIFLMMAAHDTSTSTMTTMAYHLAANPEWQDRCRDESARIGDGPLDIEALDKLETYDLVINEALRMVTPLPMNFRRAVRDTDLLGYFIPAGTDVVTWPSLNHRLPELWTDPEKFDPDRFAEPRSSTRSTATPSRRSAAARTSASAWCSASWRSRPSCTGCCVSTDSSWSAPATSRATTTAECRSRSTACRSCCARCANAVRPRSAAGWRTR